MARKLRHALDSATARLKLQPRPRAYAGPALAKGIKLLYARRKHNGSWIVKASDGSGRYWEDTFAQADDFEASDGRKVLSFHEAVEQAKKLARGTDETAGNPPITVEGALDYYAEDLKSRGAKVYNSRYPKVHLSKALLAKPVQSLDSKELQRWRNGLISAIKPSTINRLVKVLCAALEIAANHDERIQNRSAWKVGLAMLPDASEARDVVILDKVGALVAAAYDRDPKLGLLVDTLAMTGTRPGQAVRLRVEDFVDDPIRPKLSMPRSGKGGGRNRIKKKVERVSVPITSRAAAKFREAVKGRPGHEPLLLRSEGTPWNADPNQDYRDDIRAIVTSLGLDPDRYTMYCLRHSSICRALLAGVQPALVAKLHDTGISQIERNYAKYITETDEADDHARKGLLHHDEPPPEPVADNVISLPVR